MAPATPTPAKASSPTSVTRSASARPTSRTAISGQRLPRSDDAERHANAVCAASIQTANSRNFKAGLNFFFNKILNHLNLEFQVEPRPVGIRFPGDQQHQRGLYPTARGPRSRRRAEHQLEGGGAEVVPGGLERAVLANAVQY